MRLKETTLEGFVSMIKSSGRKIVGYGAGVIGKLAFPAFIEKNDLADQVLFIADADARKQGEAVQIGNREVAICSAECFHAIRGDFVVLITSSRYGTVLEYLERLDILEGIDAYILPQMLVKECRTFERQPIVRKSETPMIPRVIHYCWFGGSALPDELKKCQESWRRFCPGYQIVEWNEENYDVGKYAYTRQAYRHCKWSFVSDMARLDILHAQGGIYLDTDVELIRGLDELLCQPGFVGVEKWGVINTGGGCGAVPGHPAIRRMLDYRLSFSFERKDGSLNLESSGYYESKPLTDCGFRAENILQTIDDLTVYTSDFFHPYDYMSKETYITENTYGIHHFKGSWV